MLLDKLGQLRSRGPNRRWYAVSIIIHVVVLAGIILLFRPFQPVRKVTYIDLGPSVEMPPYQPEAGGRRGQQGATPRRRSAPPLPEVATTTRGIPVPVPSDTITPRSEGQDSGAIDTHRQLGPDYGDGRLWVRAGDAADGRVPARIAVDSLANKVARVDSLLAQRIRTYLDTVPPDSFATRSAPKWTTEIAGKTWGIDGKWIYLGGVKVPTAVLALLPIPANAAGNYDGQRQAAALEARRRDIMEAAQRASNAVEFRKYVKELRERKEMEHRAREEPPSAPSDTTTAPPLYP